MFDRFLIGAVLGGVAVWIWRNDIQNYVERFGRNSSSIRSKVADTLQSVQETAENVLDKTKQHVSANLERGREAIRPSGEMQRVGGEMRRP